VSATSSCLAGRLTQGNFFILILFQRSGLLSVYSAEAPGGTFPVGGDGVKGPLDRMYIISVYSLLSVRSRGSAPRRFPTGPLHQAQSVDVLDYNLYCRIEGGQCGGARAQWPTPCSGGHARSTAIAVLAASPAGLTTPGPPQLARQRSANASENPSSRIPMATSAGSDARPMGEQARWTPKFLRGAPGRKRRAGAARAAGLVDCRRSKAQGLSPFMSLYIVLYYIL